MERSLKITRELIVESYKKCGLRPCNGDTFRGACCCPIAAICLANGLDKKTIQNKNLEDLIDAPQDYVSGFIHGVDGEEPLFIDNEQYMEGYELGNDCYAEIEAGTLVPERTNE